MVYLYKGFCILKHFLFFHSQPTTRQKKCVILLNISLEIGKMPWSKCLMQNKRIFDFQSSYPATAFTIPPTICLEYIFWHHWIGQFFSYLQKELIRLRDIFFSSTISFRSESKCLSIFKPKLCSCYCLCYNWVETVNLFGKVTQCKERHRIMFCHKKRFHDYDNTPNWIHI